MSSRERGQWRKGWFVVPHEVLLCDIDAFGHVNNAVYLTYFETARYLLWFELVGGAEPRDITFIVARAEVDFRKQLGMEPIEICIRIGDVRNSSFETVYEIRKKDGEIAAEGKVVVVLYDWARQTKVAVDDELRRKLSACSQRGF